MARQSGKSYAVTVEPVESRDAAGQTTSCIRVYLTFGPARVRLIQSGAEAGMYAFSSSSFRNPAIMTHLRQAILRCVGNGTVVGIQLLTEPEFTGQLCIYLSTRGQGKLEAFGTAIQQAMQEYTGATVRLIVFNPDLR